MITFQCGRETVALQSGARWNMPLAAGATYRDTGEDELRAIVREVEAGRPWTEAVAARYADRHPWLHQIVTSPARDLFFRQQPPPAGARVLDIGAGWGQTAIPLARAEGTEVTAVEPTPERLGFIEAAARQEGVAGRMHFVQADFFELEFAPGFDLACCIGVLEWVPRFRPGNPRELQLEFLRRARRLLAPGGRLVIGIENRLGLKYVLGTPDDHLGVANVAVYDAGLAARKWAAHAKQELRSFTFTRAELAQLLEEAGFKNAAFFAALPDYKLPQVILPLGEEVNDYFTQGGFVPEHDGSNGRRLDIQAELQSHYRSLAELRIAHEFAPSFYVVATSV